MKLKVPKTHLCQQPKQYIRTYSMLSPANNNDRDNQIPDHVERIRLLQRTGGDDSSL